MSYILDALRKSEQQRQRGVAPSLFTAQISSNVGKQPAFPLYGVVAAILICAGILIGWLRPWQQEKTGTAMESIIPRLHESKPPQTVPTPQSLLPEPEMARKPEQALPVQKSTSTMEPLFVPGANSMKQDVPAPFKAGAQTYRSQPIQTGKALPEEAPTRIVNEMAAPTEGKAISSTLEGPVNNGSAEAVQEQKIIAMAELPLAIQQEIPLLSVSAHVYSSIPKGRLVRVNDRLLHEGEYLTHGLRLEQITPDGMVFSYKKYLFHLGLQ